MKFGGFHAKDFGSDEKNTAFSGRSSPFMYICIGFCRKIQQNPLFMKSSGFHGEIGRIS